MNYISLKVFRNPAMIIKVFKGVHFYSAEYDIFGKVVIIFEKIAEIHSHF